MEELRAASSDPERYWERARAPLICSCDQMRRGGAPVIAPEGMRPPRDQSRTIEFFRQPGVRSDGANHRPQGWRLPFLGWVVGPGEAQDSLFSRRDAFGFGGSNPGKTRGRDANGA